MKSLYSISTVVLLALLSFDGLAKREDVEKTKTIDKTYNVKGGELLKIKNSFGKVHINTWDKMIITVNVVVIARRRNEERAQETLDKIDINIAESAGVYSFETNINGQMNNQNSEGFEINYTVNMPSNNPIDVSNSFGDLYISNRSGDNTLNISYGDLKIERLTGKSDVKISFSDGSIKEIKSGEIVIKYSDVNLEQLGVVKLHQEFSDVIVGKATTIDLISKYGEMRIEEVEGLKGTVGFSGFEIGKLGVELDMDASYSSNFEIEEIAKTFKRINIEGKFGAIKLGFIDGTNATFEIETKYCEFRPNHPNVELNYQVKSDFKGEYRGKIGNGSGGTIRVASSYGDVKFE